MTNLLSSRLGMDWGSGGESGSPSAPHSVAVYFCELAETAWSEGKVRLSLKYLKQSLNSDNSCVRASYLQGLYEMKLSHYKQAITSCRHIQDADVERLRTHTQIKLNLEMAPTEELLEFSLNITPEMVMLVPEGRNEITTEGGLDVIRHEKHLKLWVSSGGQVT